MPFAAPGEGGDRSMPLLSTSQNGWPVISSGLDSRLVAIPHIIGRVRSGDIAIIFTDLVRWYEKVIEPIGNFRDDWGFAYRAVRGSTTTASNHSSGTAVDINATEHPLGVWNTYTAAEKALLNARMDYYEGVIRPGYRYTRRPDDMHYEIDRPPTAAGLADLARVAKKILKNGYGWTPSSVTVTTPVISKEFNMEEIAADVKIIKVNTATAFGSLGGREYINEHNKTTANRVWKGTHVHRGGVPIDVLQDLANTGTNTNTILGELTGIKKILNDLLAGQGVDADAAFAAARAGAAEGAAEGATDPRELAVMVVEEMRPELAEVATEIFGNAVGTALSEEELSDIGNAVVNAFYERFKPDQTI